MCLIPDFLGWQNIFNNQATQPPAKTAFGRRLLSVAMDSAKKLFEFDSRNLL